MFEKLFKEPSTVDRYRAAPLAEHRLRYLQHLAESGVKPGTLRRVACDQIRAVRLLGLQEGDRVSISRIQATAGGWARLRSHEHVRTPPESPKSMGEYWRRIVRWMRFLGWLEELPVEEHQHASEVAAFAAWMRDQRGLSDETVRVYCRMVNELFDSQVTSKIPLASTTITDVDRFFTVKNAGGRYRRKTISLYAVSLRAFFRFAADRGWCMPEIAPAIKPTRVYLDEPVPNGLNRADVQRLLSTTEGDRPADKRDRAILLLFAGYGLRAGEVGGLQLDDLDWERETLRVRRPKSGRTEFYPLSRGVAQAILRYLLEARPAHPERTLFLALTAPIGPLSRGALGTIVRGRLKRLGIVAGRRGPHALRHAAAQHLLDQGMSMKVIGDYLGHRNQSTTAVYAKVHLNALREVADFDLECLT